MFQLFGKRAASGTLTETGKDLSVQRNWDERKLSQLEAFVEKLGRLPRQASLDPEERRIATFSGTLLRFNRRSGLPNEVLQRLKAMRGMPAEAWGRSWPEQCRELLAWMRLHRRPPAHRNAVLPAEVLAALRESASSAGMCASWAIADNAMDTCAGHLEALRRWVVQAGRLPKQSALDKEERSLARLLAAVHRKHRAQRLPTKLARILLTVPGVQARLDWGQQLAALLKSGLSPTEARRAGRDSAFQKGKGKSSKGKGRSSKGKSKKGAKSKGKSSKGVPSTGRGGALKGKASSKGGWSRGRGTAI